MTARRMAVGNVFQIRHQDLAVAETADNSEAEERKLADAIETSRRQLEALQYKLHGQADANKAAIFAAHQEVMDDPELHDMVCSTILKGKSAGFAWQQMINATARRLAHINNPAGGAPAMNGRRQRVMQNQTVTGPRKSTRPPSHRCDRRLTPSDTANLDRSKSRELHDSRRRHPMPPNRPLAGNPRWPE